MIQRLICTCLFLPLLALLLALAPTSDCSAAQWGMYQHDPQHTGKGAGIGPSSVVAPKMKSEVKRFIAGTAVADDGTIYAADNFNAYALNPDGTVKFALPNIGVCCSAPVIGKDGTVYFSGNALYAVNPDTFTIKWSYGPGRTCCGNMIVGSDGTIYVANGALHAVNPDGTVKWVFNPADGSSIAAAPSLSIDGTTVYVATDKSLYFLEPTTPSTLAVVRYQISISNYAGTAPLVDQNGTIYIPSLSSILVVNPSGMVMRTIQLDSGKQVANMAYDAQNSTLICTVYGVQMNTSGTLPPMLWTANGELTAIDLITATVRWVCPITGGMDVVMDRMPYAKPIIDASGAIYLATGVYSAPGIEAGVHFYGFAPAGNLMFDYFTQSTQPSDPLPPSDTRLPTMANNGTIYLLLDGAVQAFAPLTITATAGPHGSIMACDPYPGTCTPYPSGTTQLTTLINGSKFVSMDADQGYLIDELKIDGVLVPEAKGQQHYGYNFSTVTADHTISATFKALTITATAGPHGSIMACDPYPGTCTPYPSGTTQLTTLINGSKFVSMDADQGYLIDELKIDGVLVPEAKGQQHYGYNFSTVTADHTISATFKALTITATAGPHGSIMACDPYPGTCTPYPSGTTQLTTLINGSKFVSMDADQGYLIDELKIDGVLVPEAKGQQHYGYNFSTVTADHTISATFKALTITATAGPHGSIMACDPYPGTCTPYPSGTTQLTTLVNGSKFVSMDADQGYLIDELKIDGVLVPEAKGQQHYGYNFSTVTADHTISATFKALTITATAGPHGSIMACDPYPGTCTPYPSGTTQLTTLVNGSKFVSMDADQGYLIDELKIDGVLVPEAKGQQHYGYNFSTVTADHTISATFKTQTFTITASAGAGGNITPSGPVTVSSGASQSFSIAANAGYLIADLLVDGVSVGPVTSYTFGNVTGNHTISASFKIQTFTITASAGTGGNISPSGPVTVSSGASQSFSIAANAGYLIADLLVDGVSVGPVTSYTFGNVTGNHTISASFKIQTFTITASAGAGGNISPSGAVTVSSGASQSFGIAANAGYLIADLLVDGVSAGPVTSYTFGNVTGNHTISASFKVQTFTINASAGTNGTISPTGAVTVPMNSNQTFNITANAGYTINTIVVDGVSLANVKGSTNFSYTFNKVIANHTISATFQVLSAINVTSPNGGEVWKKGTLYTIKWTYTGTVGTQVKIELLKGGVLNSTLSKGTTIGTNGIGTFNWKVPTTLANGSDYTIRITSTSNSSFSDTSNGSFTITK